MAYSAPTNMPGSRTVPTSDADAGAQRAYRTLHFGFTVLPLLAGIDKFTEVLADWDKYLAPIVPQTIGVGTHSIMMAVGAIEIIAAMLVAFRPRLGANVVALWLLGIIGNLALNPNHYWDVAARDFGLFLGAVALASLSQWAHRPPKLG